MIVSDELGPAAESRLSAFLASPQRPEGTLRVNELKGFLFAIACAPEMIPFSDWQLLVFNDEDPNFSDLEEAKEITDAILTLYNQSNHQVIEGQIELPESCRPIESPLANLAEDTGISQWANGFLYGHSYLEELWTEYLPESLDEELGSCVMVLSYFSDLELAEAYHRESGNENVSLEQMTQAVLDLFGEAMASYAHMGRSIYAALLEEQEYEQESEDGEGIAGDDLCPCGSGSKFNECCGAPRVLH